jgi:hypothetical protein
MSACRDPRHRKTVRGAFGVRGSSRATHEGFVMRSLKHELIAISVKGVIAFGVGYGSIAYAMAPAKRAPGVYTDNERANLTQFVKKYVAPAPKKRRSQWKG